MSEQNLVNTVKGEVDARVENLGEAVKAVAAGADIPADVLAILADVTRDLGDAGQVGLGGGIDIIVKNAKRLTAALAKLGGVVTGD